MLSVLCPGWVRLFRMTQKHLLLSQLLAFVNWYYHKVADIQFQKAVMDLNLSLQPNFRIYTIVCFSICPVVTLHQLCKSWSFSWNHWTACIFCLKFILNDFRKGRTRQITKESLSRLFAKKEAIDSVDQGDHINLPDQPRLAELSWLDRLDSLPGFRAAAGIVVKGLRKALYSETDSQTITKYISYLYSHVGSEDFDTLSLGMVIFF